MRITIDITEDEINQVVKCKDLYQFWMRDSNLHMASVCFKILKSVNKKSPKKKLRDAQSILESYAYNKTY